MPKPTKNIIDRSFIEKELGFCNSANIKACLVMCAILSVLCVPLTVGTVYTAATLPKALLFKILLSILLGALTALPIFLAFANLGLLLSRRRMLKRGAFEVSSRGLSYKGDKLVRRHTEEFFRFKDFKDIVVNHTTFQLASVGDTFYIVHYKEKREIELLYSEKMYEYK